VGVKNLAFSKKKEEKEGDSFELLFFGQVQSFCHKGE